MHQKTKDLQKRYEGFLQTACLWKLNDIFNIQQFVINQQSSKITIDIPENLRLGKYVERFVSFQLSEDPSIKVISENIQIQQERRTIGELDCLLSRNHKNIHLEIIYKFYLYDASVGNTEITHFIGRNRKDSLLEKLEKLKHKQLPLLFDNATLPYLKSKNLLSENITQQVYFKAQLFMPYESKELELKKINTNCIEGFYISKRQLPLFSNCKFHIPSKKDWLCKPHKDIDWLSFAEFKINTEVFLERQFSPLCWMMKPNGVLEKFFLVWWS